MALFQGIQEYIALNANNITLVFDSGNIVNISGNIFLYPPQGHPILYNYHCLFCRRIQRNALQIWQRYPQQRKAEEEREKRKEQMRKKVASMLPDFQGFSLSS